MARIEDVIKAGETEFVEFKTSFNAEAVESLVAFANSKGGQVLSVLWILRDLRMTVRMLLWIWKA